MWTNHRRKGRIRTMSIHVNLEFQGPYCPLKVQTTCLFVSQACSLHSQAPPPQDQHHHHYCPLQHRIGPSPFVKMLLPPVKSVCPSLCKNVCPSSPACEKCLTHKLFVPHGKINCLSPKGKTKRGYIYFQTNISLQHVEETFI